MKNNKIKNFWTGLYLCNSYGISFDRHNSDCWVSAAENEVKCKYFLNVKWCYILTEIHIAGNKNTSGSAFYWRNKQAVVWLRWYEQDGKLSVADVTALQIHISE